MDECPQEFVQAPGYSRPMKVGLVLGAGGVTGGAWLTGALHALVDATGWDPGSADVVVGTSAGAMIGTLVAAGGVPPWFMRAHSAGEVFEGLTDRSGNPAAEADRSAGAEFRFARAVPLPGPGSWKMAMRTLRNPRRHSPSAVMMPWLPAGMVSTEPLKGIVRSVVPEGWGAHPRLWLMACDYDTGRRVAFGREGAPMAELADAAAASCAIPGFYRPVEIRGRRYVDGGVNSVSNLDVVAREELDLVLCFNPASTRERMGGAIGAWRAAAGRRLGREARKVRESGTEVVLIQPVADDLAVMGPNPMSRRRNNEVIETAIRTTTDALRAAGVAELVRDLPVGPDHVRFRPPGPASDWPSFDELAAARWPQAS
jgi:NTE family protein